MASGLLLRKPLLTTTLGLTSSLFLLSQTTSLLRPQPVHLSTSPSSSSAKDWTFSSASQSSANTPIISAQTARQLSLGSILGLVAGLGVSVFSKPLAILLGLGIAATQTLESYLGVRIVPYRMLQRYVSEGVDLQAWLRRNAVAKISFGIMFALSGFAEF